MNFLTYGAFGIAIVFAIFAFIVAVSLRRVVPTNMVHIVQSTKSTTPYGRGKEAGNTYYAWPAWLPKLGVTVIEFPESIFQVSLQDYEAYDQARLPFVVDVTAFFRIEKAEVAAQRVASFHELQRDLQAVLQGAVRRILATNSLESIMQSRSELGDQFTEEVKEQISEWGVLPVKTIEFMDLRDSNKGSVIANIMAKEQSRITMESRVKVAENGRTAEMAEIDAQRTIEVQRQDAAQQIGLRTAEKDKTVGIAQEQSQQEVMAAAKTTAERAMDVKKVEDVRAAEIQKEVSIVAAEGVKQAQIVAADGNKEAAIREAEGIRARGEAEAAAEKAMLLAPVETQIRLASEIGQNPGYQTYLISIEKVKAGQVVGVELAQAMKSADLKVIANSGDMQGGVTKLGDLFTTGGGMNLTGMLSALSSTEEGKSLLAGLTGKLGEAAKASVVVGGLTGSEVAAGAAGAVAAVTTA